MKIMPQVGILNSYQEYQKALLARRFVDEMNRREINLGVESTIEVIAKNPKEYGLYVSYIILKVFFK